MSLCSVLAASLVVVPDASARGTGGIFAHAAHGDRAGCFDEAFGGIKNKCSGQEHAVIPVLLDTTNPPKVRVRARGLNRTQGVSCQPLSVLDPNTGAFVVGSTATTVRNNNTVEELNTAFPGVHSFGAFYVFCKLDPETVVLSAHYWE